MYGPILTYINIIIVVTQLWWKTVCVYTNTRAINSTHYRDIKCTYNRPQKQFYIFHYFIMYNMNREKTIILPAQ